MTYSYLPVLYHPMISNDDFLVWRAQQAPYHIIVIGDVHDMLVVVHARGIFWEVACDEILYIS